MPQYNAKKTIQIKQQEIRSLLENFNWETNPCWAKMLMNIKNEIDDYWLNYLQRKMLSEHTISTIIHTYNTK
jgi:hypothetical protein